MKPLIRWTIGNTSENGLKCLEYSIRKVKKIYSTKFDYVLCYNEINPYLLKDIPIEKIDQKKIKKNINVKESGWKLIPPKLNSQGKEIWIDNDLILNKKLKEIDQLLENNIPFIAQGLYGLYGVFQEKLPKNVKMCAGIFGLPDYLNLEEEILKSKIKTFSHFDEQGLISYICHTNNSNIISFSDISNCETSLQKAICGYHFVGLNRSVEHYAWNCFIQGKYL